MKSVTLKKPAKPKKPLYQPKLAHWYKTRVHFAAQKDVLEHSLRCALALRHRYPGVYFARYTNVATGSPHYTDFYVQCYGVFRRAAEREQIRRVITDTCRNRPVPPNVLIDLPADHEGSEAHAAGFDCVAKLCVAFCLTDDESEARGSTQELHAAMADVQHWMNNMFGIDYLDEARQALYTAGRVLDAIQPRP